MEEHVTLKLETYEYFKGLERHKQSKTLAELLRPVMVKKPSFDPKSLQFYYTNPKTISKEKLENLIKEVFGMSEDTTLEWE
ncbi:hypothetical protein [Listeria seeligeri]|uniref:hypothetical protein n=1 Tax=Listeria seeligeri TaxID=1640 RepID=UPI0016232883|nr:hypothetical protein [Listeria seeligeri]MBC1832308.1 hypothetical protein [Listeria seeligeri]MBC1851153.1 hypothetical protein [Listeria seeligeri]MBC1929363.1 hypothetical protein [Listeria seeligeri]MBC6130509.1 hypothetical protein [Listeria seeligeri]MBF2370249.1 hypothetical protein [Listeria seeligeri]